MTDSFSSDSSSMDPMDPMEQGLSDEQRALAASLASTLDRRAAQVEPSSDSYLRLRRAVDDGTTPRHAGPAGIGPSRPLAVRVLAVAAGVVALIASAAWINSRGGSQLIDSAPAAATTTTPPVAPSVTTTIAEALPVEPQLVPPAYTEVPWDSVTGPRRLDPIEAAAAFLSFIRMPYAALDMVDTDVRVFGGDDGATVIAELDVVAVEMFDPSLGTGFSVVGATSDAVAVDVPLAGSVVVDQTFLVEGAVLTGGQATTSIELFSNHDGLLLDRRTSTGDTSGPVVVDLAVDGADQGWIVMSAFGDGTAGFSAVPIEWDAGMDPAEYMVSHIAIDDPDQGLNVRALPGADEGEVLATLPPATSGIRRRGRVPSFIGAQRWLSIITDDGVEGWVNDRYLVRIDDVEEGALHDVALAFAEAVATPDNPDLMASLPWATHKPVSVGWYGGLEQLDQSVLRTAAVWDQPSAWALPDTFDATTERSLRELVAVDTAAIGIAHPPGSTIAGSAVASEVAPWSFAGLWSVSLDAGPSGRQDSTVTLYVEPTVEGPRIVGLALDFGAS